ncbi:hypothetical protein [Sphingomonas sp. RIT328]|uniref:hypothetical protein n=1 Tax=Sphingomonas sp. RIT328 TaxID=1470591 RepID=UPI0004486890|nr:hypothetical protein [Sphingomonas sp. RIT328]EZP50044.1 hypothetical protein BW41_03369 [Sphingomonas sp. RIT328]
MLIGRIDKFLRRTRMAPTRFGRLAAHDPNLVFDLRDGRDPRNGTVKKINAWLDRAERAYAEEGEIDS